MQQPVVVAVSNPQVQHSPALEVLEDRSHRRCGFAILPEGRARLVANFLEGPVMLVVKQEIFRAVVGNVDVVPAIVVEVRRRHSHGAAHIGADTRLVGYIRKCAVTVVVVELVGLSLVIQRSRIVVSSVVGAVFGIELDVPAYEQIDAAVLVVVEPRGTDGPAVHLDAGLRGHVGEVAVAVVVIEDGLAIAGDQQIDETIVVVIRRRHGHSV